MPDLTITDVSYAAGAAGSATSKQDLVVTPKSDFPSVGVYTYTVTETDGKTAGVTYNKEKLELKATVFHDAATGALIRVITTGARVASATTVAAAALIAVGILVIGHVVSVRSGMRARRYLLASLNSRRKPENMPLVLPSCSPTTRAAF